MLAENLNDERPAASQTNKRIKREGEYKHHTGVDERQKGKGCDWGIGMGVSESSGECVRKHQVTMGATVEGLHGEA